MCTHKEIFLNVSYVRQVFPSLPIATGVSFVLNLNSFPRINTKRETW